MNGYVVQVPVQDFQTVQQGQLLAQVDDRIYRQRLEQAEARKDEIIRFAGRHENSRIVRVIMAPGLALQWMTTKHPDSSQVEVAIAALEEIIALEPQDRPPVKGVEVMA